MDTPDLIASFKTIHQEIVDSIDQIHPLLRSYLQAKAKLRELHSRIMAHLSRQNSEFYGNLRREYEKNREALKMLEFLEHDLKEVKIKYLLFADSHSGELGDINARSFPKDFTDFSSIILARINIEEEYLFPLLERLS